MRRTPILKTILDGNEVSEEDLARLRLKLGVLLGYVRGLSTLSTCRRRQFGCAVVPLDLTEVYAIGYNGPASGEDNGSCTGVVGDCRCCHAEANAVSKLRTLDDECLMVVGATPCLHCAGLIVNSHRIGYYVYESEYRDPRGLERLVGAGVKTVHVEDLMPTVVECGGPSETVRVTGIAGASTELESILRASVDPERSKSRTKRIPCPDCEGGRRPGLLCERCGGSRTILVEVERSTN